MLAIKTKYEVPNDFREAVNDFTRDALLHVLREEGDDYIDNSVRRLIDETDDEAKRIYELANSLKHGCIIATPLESIKDKFYNELLFEILECKIDYYEIAKTLYTQYTKRHAA